MIKLTKEQIEEEIEILKSIRSNTSSKATIDFSGVYPDTIHSLIDAQIQVLEKRMSSDYIMDHYSVDSDDGECYKIIPYGVMSIMDEASSWMEDIYPAPPSKMWINNEYKRSEN